MAEQDARWLHIADPFDAGHGQFEVELRRRGGRPEDTHVRKEHTERVADEHAARSRIEQRHVVARVTGRVQDPELASPQRDSVAVGHGPEPLDRNGVYRSEQRPQAFLTVDTSRAGHQAVGVSEVRRAALVHPDGRRREVGCQRSGTPGVIEMDVRHHDVSQILRADAQRVESLAHGVDGGRRPGLDKRGPIGVEQVGRGKPGATEHAGVDPSDPLRRLERVDHGRSVPAALLGDVSTPC